MYDPHSETVSWGFPLLNDFFEFRHSIVVVKSNAQSSLPMSSCFDVVLVDIGF